MILSISISTTINRICASSATIWPNAVCGSVPACAEWHRLIELSYRNAIVQPL